MTVTASVVRSADRLARLALRVPLTALDQRVVLPTLGSGSSVHRVLSATVGLLNPGATSPDDGAERRDAPTAERPAADDHPAGAPAAERRAADAQPAEGFAPVEAAEVETLADDLLRDQQDERFVGELADDELRRVQAEVRAKQILEDPDHT